MNILHTYLHFSTFVRKDESILKDAGRVHSYAFKVDRKHHLPLRLIEQLFFLLRKGWSFDLFVCQFAGYHSFLPCLFARITGKKSIIISGGTDCVSFPGIGYGNFNRPVLKNFTAWSFRLCDHMAPKHSTLFACDYRYDPNEPASQGVQAFLPEIHLPYTVIENGYDPEKWKAQSNARTPNSFFTLSGAFEYPFQVALKGIDLILEVARRFPEYRFTIAGVPKGIELPEHSPNVTVLPPIPNAELSAEYSKHTFYLQLSMAEGFPNALCEAMLCGCTPVVAGVFSMPEIVNGEGYILEHRSVHELEVLLKHVEPRNPEKIRQLIASRFTETRRRELLLRLIEKVTGSMVHPVT